MIDPVEIAAIDIRAVRLAHGLVNDLAPSDLDRTDAWRLLANLHTAGWRIVRLEECEDGPCEVGDEPDEYPQHIVEEWTPVADAGERTR